MKIISLSFIGLICFISFFPTLGNSSDQKDDLSVEIDKYVYPESIWLNEPIITTCNYKFDLKGGTGIPPFKDFISVNFIFSVKRKIVTGPLSQYVAENNSEKPSYPEETGNELRKTVLIENTNGYSPKKVITGSFQIVHYPTHEGEYEIICRAFNNQLNQKNKDNDRDEVKFSVYGVQPVKFQHIPVPAIIKPIRKVVLINPYTQYIDLEGFIDPREAIDSGFWISPETWSIVFEEKWNFKIEKRVRNVGKKYKTIDTFSGLFKNQTDNGPIYFKTKVTKDTLDKMDDGEYRLSSWLSQENIPTGNTTTSTRGGPAIFEFTVVREGPNKLSDDLVLEKSDDINNIAIPREAEMPKDKQAVPAEKSQDIKIFMPKSVLRTTAMHGTNLFGMDYRHIKTDIWEDCPKACSSDTKCKSWTWVKPGIKGPEGVCFLKNGIPEKSQNECCVSGIK